MRMHAVHGQMTSGPSFCWWCMGDLHPGRTGPIHSLVRDPVGHLHRVHHACVGHAAADGNVPVQAQLPPDGQFDPDDGAGCAIHYVDGGARADE